MRPAQRLLLISTVLSLLLVFITNYLPSQQPYIVIDATTEILTYRVRRPEIAAIPLFNATLRGAFDNCPWPTLSESNLPATGILKPVRGSIVKYRFTPERIAIEIEGGDHSAASITLPNGTFYNLPSRVVAIIDTGPRVRPLPIAGPAEIGREFGGLSVRAGHPPRSNDFMYGGTVKVFGYALLPPFKGSLYSSGSEFSLPAGGRLTSDDNFDPFETQTTAAPWFGIAELIEKGFKVSATTVSADLRMYRPGATGETERFALGALTRVFNDPSMAVITIFICTFSFIITPLEILIGVKNNTNDAITCNNKA